jgi:hypothetical protein
MGKYGKEATRATCIAPECVGRYSSSENPCGKGSQLEIAIDQHEQMLYHLTRSRVSGLAADRLEIRQ